MERIKKRIQSPITDRPGPGSGTGHPNLLLTVLTTLFITGIVIGAICARSAGNDVIEKLVQVIRNYTEIRSQQSMAGNFGNSFAMGMLCLILLYLAGVTAWGAPVALLMPVFKGMGYGIVCGTLYADYAARGFGYAALVILPGTLISTLAILIAAKECARFSCGIFTEICLSRSSRRDSVKNYSIRFLLLVLFILLSAAADMMAIRLFSGVFLTK